MDDVELADEAREEEEGDRLGEDEDKIGDEQEAGFAQVEKRVRTAGGGATGTVRNLRIRYVMLVGAVCGVVCVRVGGYYRTWIRDLPGVYACIGICRDCICIETYTIHHRRTTTHIDTLYIHTLSPQPPFLHPPPLTYTHTHTHNTHVHQGGHCQIPPQPGRQFRPL